MNRREFLYLNSVTAISILTCNNLFADKISSQSSGETGFVFDEIYLKHWLEPGHPESPARLRSIMELMQNSALMEYLNIIKPGQLEVMPYLTTIHTSEHINNIRIRYEISHEVAIAVVEGVLGATDKVCKGELKNAFCATRPPGHHATNTGKVEGFCFYNSIAVAARYAQVKYGLKKILIIDWDYHHGNGTEAAFYKDSSVLFFSTHDLYAYPGTGFPEKTGEGEGEGYNINVHLGCGTTDDDIISAFEKYLVPAVEKFKPDLILISAGFDSRKDDLLGCYNVTDNGFIELTELVMSLAKKYCNDRVVSVLEGGYNIEGNASAVKHHVNTLMNK